MKQTAVEFLEEKAMNGFITPEDFEQAKEMEKERMINFAKYCLNNAKHLNFDKALFNVEEYYQIFKSVKHNTDIRSMDKLIESNKKFDENNRKGFKYDPNDRSEDTPDITNFFY